MKKELECISDEAKDYAKQLLNVLCEFEDKYFAMINKPKLYRDEWEGVIQFIRETCDDDCYVADEIEEMLMEL